MKKLYFIDVDGTVANCEHRAHLINGADRSPGAWDAFFSYDEMMKDTPIESARRHFKDGEFIHGDFVYLTARIESTYNTTRGWLLDHGFATLNTRIICKPDAIRLQRSKVFKPSVLSTAKIYGYPKREFVLIEDYGEVRRAAEEAGFKVLHAPNCWDSDLCWG